MYELRITTYDDPAYPMTVTRRVRRRPAKWKSWLMQECPRGTVFTGADFECIHLG